MVCCDLDLPDGSGMDFLDEVRAADKELPFILASCHDKDDYEQEAMRLGRDAVHGQNERAAMLQKGFDLILRFLDLGSQSAGFLRIRK